MLSAHACDLPHSTLRTDVGAAPLIRTCALHAGFGGKNVLHNVSTHIERHSVSAIIGPSGCGKSTLLRCLNRMHELNPNAHQEGEIELDGEDILSPEIDPVALRRRIGMVFQKPNPFPHMSVKENVLAGLRLTGRLERDARDAIVQRALESTGLWHEVKDRLHHSGVSLSGGQQQRLCIARALAVAPDLVLMDEPCSALDPVATSHIESLIRELSARYTIVLVTHNMQQAARVSHQTLFLYEGILVEQNATTTLFQQPQDPRTQAYLDGQFG